MKKNLFGIVALSTMNVYAADSFPNFVLFIADDCSYYDIGCYGSVDSKTPNIDAFANEGMLFTKAYQAVPMSSPTRHNLYTGVWPVKSGAYPNHTFANESTKSIVHHLHPLGYKVALIGKSHVEPSTVFPFDLYVPLTKSRDIDFNAIEDFIDDCCDHGIPYCLIVASNQPHTPWNKGDSSIFDKNKVSLPPIYVDVDETRVGFVNYLAEINYMDGEFGRLLFILNNKKQADNSVVVYLSEQGNSLPFAKWTCYDAGVHSACIVRWPGKIKKGCKTDAMVEYIDILPTFIDIAGGEPVCKLDGLSFKDVLLGKKHNHKDYTYSMQTTRGIHKGSDYYGIRSVSDGKFRYILNLTPYVKFKNSATSSKLFKRWLELAKTDKKAREITSSYMKRPAIELYDIENDPFCQNNLSGKDEYADKELELSEKLKAWMHECGDKGHETELKAYEHIFKKR